MKTTMKLFAAIVIMLGIVSTTFGQQSSNATITGLANVAAQVNVTGNGSLEFGNVTPGNTKTISNGGIVAAGTIGGTTETEGKFIVTKGANSQVTLSFALPSSLTSGTATLPINFNDYSTNKCGRIGYTSQTDVPFTPTSPITAANSGATAWVFAATTFDVHIGGTVIPATNQTAGAYTGNITLTATYN